MHRNNYIAIWVGILWFVFVLATYGQEGAGGTALSYGGPPDPEQMAMRRGELSGLGFTFINGEPFLRFQLQPEIDLGKVGFGLGLVLLYSSSDDGEHTILAEDGETWDDISTILRDNTLCTLWPSQRAALHPFRCTRLRYYWARIHYVRLFKL